MEIMIKFLRDYAWGIIAVCFILAALSCLVANWVDGFYYFGIGIMVIPAIYLLVAIVGMLWNLVKKI